MQEVMENDKFGADKTLCVTIQRFNRSFGTYNWITGSMMSFLYRPTNIHTHWPVGRLPAVHHEYSNKFYIGCSLCTSTAKASEPIFFATNGLTEAILCLLGSEVVVVRTFLLSEDKVIIVKLGEKKTYIRLIGKIFEINTVCSEFSYSIGSVCSTCEWLTASRMLYDVEWPCVGAAVRGSAHRDVVLYIRRHWHAGELLACR